MRQHARRRILRTRRQDVSNPERKHHANPIHHPGHPALRQDHRSLQAHPLGHRPRRDPRPQLRPGPHLPARRSVAGRRTALPEPGRAPVPQPGAGPHLRQHVRPGRTLHQRQDAGGEPRALARRPDRAGGHRALHRRRAETPGAVPPHRTAGGRRHAGRLPLRRVTQRRGRVRAGQEQLGRAGADLPHRAVLAGALPRQHRRRQGPVTPVQGRVPVPLEGRVAARHHRRAGMGT
ncbi:hypothetical protein Y695_04182 [Hydrogenophaga sp. T4]|nr:hypothetical protein Y695_04182 [Hydrogenophaga sp. T4]